MARNMSTAAKRTIAVVIALIVVLVCAGAWYVSDYYRADATALAAVADEDGASDGVVVQQLSDKAIAFVPDQPSAGFIFYPGAKVQPEAYAPLMTQLAERDILCILVKPLFNLAILDVNIADGLTAQFPDVETWAIGGHSMGGVAASDYAANHEGAFESVVFLASYPTADLTGFDGTTLSLAGTNDLVLNRTNYEKAGDLLPSASTSIDIDGGNHAYFGNYGEQAGDGQATITREEQQSQAADAIAALTSSALKP
ncbi:MAG: alpha/beta hydrolase [Eggerthellaceae bacterium]|nr:alpha/beta hydrolase [Eggerthellaceae bacterium]